MAVYNGASLVGGAIESVLLQTYADLELVIVDDGSSDGSADVVAAFTDPRIRLLRNDHNRGLVASLNRGVREARGELVARLDYDDRCLPERIERQLAFLDREPQVAVAGTRVELMDEHEQPIDRPVTRLSDRAEFVFQALTNGIAISHPTVMFRREAVLAVGGYDEAMVYAEDHDLWRRLALAGHDARVLPEVLVRYRVHPGMRTLEDAGAQRALNSGSLERFYQACEPGLPLLELRLLLTGDDDFWTICATRGEAERVRAALEHLLAGVGRKLFLAEHEAARLDELVRAHVSQLARRAWRRGAAAHWRAGPIFYSWGSRGRRFRSLGSYAVVFVAAPALRPLRGLKQRASGTG